MIFVCFPEWEIVELVLLFYNHCILKSAQLFFIAFEACRKEAKLCRQEFDQVKKKRYMLFSQCFEHVTVAVDQIYKKLCRNSSAQVRNS